MYIREVGDPFPSFLGEKYKFFYLFIFLKNSSNKKKKKKRRKSPTSREVGSPSSSFYYYESTIKDHSLRVCNSSLWPKIYRKKLLKTYNLFWYFLFGYWNIHFQVNKKVRCTLNCSYAIVKDCLSFLNQLK